MDWFVIDSSLFLAATAAAEPTWLMSTLGSLQNLLYVAVGLGFVIFVHELGHFLVAKACGVKCEKFYVGFDFLEIPIPFTPWKIPRALWKMQIGETEYGIGSLPLGGYVKMLGQDDDPRNAETEAERTKVATSDDAKAEALASGDAAQGLTAGTSVEKATAEAQGKAAPNAVVAKTSDGKTVLLDPRSYTAKAIPARMAIISAGVIMNAIFAVIFATVAYRLGVREFPAAFGAVIPGDPAWVAGIEPGAKIIRFGKSEYERFRYDDLRRNVVLTGKNRDMDIKVRNLNGTEIEYKIRPMQHKDRPFPSLGVLQLGTNELFVPPVEKVEKKGAKHLLPKTDVPLEDSDAVVAVDGHQVENGTQLNALLVQRPEGKMTLTIERGLPLPKGSAPDAKVEKKSLQVVVEAKPMRELGIVVGLGPISAVRKGSPADTAGFQIGDQIETIDGEPAGDPLTLGQRLLKKVDKSVTFVVARKSKTQTVKKELTATLEAPRNLYPIDYYSAGGLPAAEPLGVTYDLVTTVASVEPNSSAAKADVQVGDQLVSAEYISPKREKQDDVDKAFAEIQKKKVDLVAEPNHWLRLNANLQSAKPDVTIQLTFKRGEKSFAVPVAPFDSTTHFDERRGLSTEIASDINQAQDWGSAFSLGLRETKERIQEVLTVLHRLVTGQLSITNLSGPPGILTAATKFASDGVPMMLMFLTMLSANLAVINFLPIPVLDGGHMVFLTAEWIRGKPVDADLQLKLTVAGMVFLFSLMIFASAMDVGRWLNL